MEDTFYNLSSGDLELNPLFHCCAMFLTCVLVVLKPVVSLMHLISCPSYWLPLMDSSGPACSLSAPALDTTSSWDFFVGLCLDLSVPLIDLPVSAVVLLSL